MQVTQSQINRIKRGVRKIVPSVTDIELGVRAGTVNSLLWGEDDDLDYTEPMEKLFKVVPTKAWEVELDLYVYTENDGLFGNLDVRIKKGVRPISIYDPFTKKGLLV